MSTHVLQPGGVLPEPPGPADLADVWLVRALAHLLDACAPVDEAHRLDASRLTVLFTALAVEARINLVVREHDPDGWGGDAQLTPLEKFQLLPRLLADSDLARHNMLAEPLVELFDLRDELVEAGSGPARFSPTSACAMLTAGAELCSFLDDGSDAARLVREAAESVATRAEAASAADLPGDWSDFPPDLVGS